MLTYIIMTVSLLLFAQSLFSVYLMLYSWQQKDTLEASKGPKQLIAQSFPLRYCYLLVMKKP